MENEPKPRVPRRLRLATYNIHRCVGRDGQFAPARIAGVLAELGADVVALQEVETRHDGGFEILPYLGSHTALTAIPGPTLRRDDGEYGNAVLTRYPVRAQRDIDLSYPRREPRRAIDLDMRLGAVDLRVIATHLGLTPAERRYQVEHLLDQLPDSDGRLTVLAGDLNEWFLWGRPLRWLRRRFRATPAPATFPARLPVLALDRIWVRPRHCLRQLYVHRSPLAAIASDHLPLVAELDVSGDRVPDVAGRSGHPGRSGFSAS